MIRKYVFGSPFETEAVVKKLQPEALQDGNAGRVPYFTMTDTHTFSYGLESQDRIYGLGENVRGINKRGWLYISNCSDDSHHQEDKHSLYAAHNFFIVDGRQRFGVFVDAPQKVSFDFGYTDRRTLTVHVEEGGFVLYILEGESLRGIVHEFRQLTGRSYIPPKWAFGYCQSRWGYKSAEEVREVVRRHRENHMPLDSVCMDIDYMERFKDFTVDEEKFPDFPEFVKEMGEQNIHLVPIIDAGVKVEKGYPVWEEGVEKGYFCKREDGSEFVCGVWPGHVHFPDVLNPDARRWFGDWYRVLIDQGIEGFWNDMNEPAMFYTEDHMAEVFDKLEQYKGTNIGIDEFMDWQQITGSIHNYPDDYKKFYHQTPAGRIRHDKVHNLFGYNMTRAAGEAFERISPDKRILIYSRSSYIGMHRYGGLWTGDNYSWWSHILLNLQMLPSLNMCGFLYIGADLGGFGVDTTEDLLLRWLGLGIFTPLMRNHSALRTRRQEYYQFGDSESFRNILGLRYGLLPYIYSEFIKAVLKDDMMFLPLSFVYPKDEDAAEVEDQLVAGESIMIAPVYRQNAGGRYVYLPEEMKLCRMRSLDDMDMEILPAGHHYVKAAVNEVLMFIRPDHMVPVSCGGECVAEVDSSKLRLLHFVKTKAVYDLYNDDGSCRDVNLEKSLTRITLEADGRITVEGAEKPECTAVYETSK